MDEFRIGSTGFVDSHSDQTRDGSKKRSRQRQVDSQEEPIDEVTLSLDADNEEESPGYSPGSPDQEPE
jgi:hypothetical protein